MTERIVLTMLAALFALLAILALAGRDYPSALLCGAIAGMIDHDRRQRGRW